MKNPHNINCAPIAHMIYVALDHAVTMDHSNSYNSYYIQGHIFTSSHSDHLTNVS